VFDILSRKFSSLMSRFTGKKSLQPAEITQLLGDIKDGMLEADIPYSAAEKFLNEVERDIQAKKLGAQAQSTNSLVKIIHDRIVEFLGGTADSEFSPQIPSVCMVIGLQGSGKTTTLAKLVRYLTVKAEKRGKKRRILLASVDFYRPAAIDQLEILAERVGAPFYRAQATDPVAAAQEIYRYSKLEQFEILMLDTAGRLHVDHDLLQELKTIEKLVRPEYKILVIDGMTGQESLGVAQAFDEAVGVTGGIMTKMDSNTHGGAAFAFRSSVGKPLLFMGTGETLDDLEPFKAERIAKRILDLGDVATLQEKVEANVEQSAQTRIYNSLKGGNFTLQDFADQMNMVSKMGSLQSLMRYLPGMGQFKVDARQMEKGEHEMKKFTAIIQSMTMLERTKPQILTNARKQRMARGAGVGTADINLLLERFEQNQQFVKMFKKMNYF
jgi:signal recognition particle subunit SRP54